MKPKFLSLIKKNIAFFFPFLLLAVYVYSPRTFFIYSNGVLGKLLAIAAILMYTSIDFLYGLLACLLVILYYQSDYFENMSNIENMSSIAIDPYAVTGSDGKSDCGCKKSKTKTKSKPLFETNNIHADDMLHLSELSSYSVENMKNSETCKLCLNSGKNGNTECEMCKMMNDIVVFDDRLKHEDFLRTEQISGRVNVIHHV